MEKTLFYISPSSLLIFQEFTQQGLPGIKMLNLKWKITAVCNRDNNKKILFFCWFCEEAGKYDSYAFIIQLTTY